MLCRLITRRSPLLSSIKPLSSVVYLRPFSTNINSNPNLNPKSDRKIEKEKLFNKYWGEAVEKHNQYVSTLSWYRRGTLFLKQYGAIGIATYWTLWGGVWCGFYFSFKYNLLDYSTWQWMHMDKLEQFYVNNLVRFGINPDHHPVTDKTKDLLVAFAAAKVTKPLQLLTTVAITPKIARSIGYAPKIPDEDLIRNKIKQMIKQQMGKK